MERNPVVIGALRRRFGIVGTRPLLLGAAFAATLSAATWGAAGSAAHADTSGGFGMLNPSGPGTMQDCGAAIGPGMMQGQGSGMPPPAFGPGMMQGPGPGMPPPGFGPGMTQGPGPGMPPPGFGPGMMQGQGPGMPPPGFGPGMMQGPGPGMPPPGFSHGMMQGQGPGPSIQAGNLNLSIDDVKTFLGRWIAWQGNSHIKLGDVKQKDADTIEADVVTKDNSLVQRFTVNRHTGIYGPSGG